MLTFSIPAHSASRRFSLKLIFCLHSLLLASSASRRFSLIFRLLSLALGLLCFKVLFGITSSPSNGKLLFSGTMVSLKKIANVVHAISGQKKAGCSKPQY